MADKGETPLTNMSAISEQGMALQVKDGEITERSGFTAKGAKDSMEQGGL